VKTQFPEIAGFNNDLISNRARHRSKRVISGTIAPNVADPSDGPTAGLTMAIIRLLQKRYLTSKWTEHAKLKKGF
jgi:hypothetical protein